MSRDHYKGTPKTVNAVIRPGNKLSKESLLQKSEYLEADARRRYSRVDSTFGKVIEYFIRNNGNDDNDGLTESTALKTLERLNEILPLDLGKDRYLVNLTGYTAQPLNKTGSLDGGVLTWRKRVGHETINIDPTVREDGAQPIYKIPLTFYAAPTVLKEITVTGKTTASTTGIVTLQVSETLVPDAYKGKFTLSSTVNARYFPIIGNTENEITISLEYYGSLNETAIDLIVEPSCDLTLGDDGYSGYQVGSYWDIGCRTMFSLIKFGKQSNSGAVSAIFRSSSNLYLFGCDIEGMMFEDITFPQPWVFGCHLTGRVYLEGSSGNFQSCFLNGASFGGHGDGGSGKVEYNGGTVILGCNSVGTGNFEQTHSIEINNILIASGTSVGVSLDSPQRVSINNSVIRDCASHAIYGATGGCYVRVRDVHGDGNVGYGLYLANGHQANLQSSGGSFPTVSGSAGEVRLGGLENVQWSALDGNLPKNDLSAGGDLVEFCRVF